MLRVTHNSALSFLQEQACRLGAGVMILAAKTATVARQALSYVPVVASFACTYVATNYVPLTIGGLAGLLAAALLMPKPEQKA